MAKFLSSGMFDMLSSSMNVCTQSFAFRQNLEAPTPTHLKCTLILATDNRFNAFFLFSFPNINIFPYSKSNFLRQIFLNRHMRYTFLEKNYSLLSDSALVEYPFIFLITSPTFMHPENIIGNRITDISRIFCQQEIQLFLQCFTYHN